MVQVIGNNDWIEARSSKVLCSVRAGKPAVKKRGIRRRDKHPKAYFWDDAEDVSDCHLGGELSA